MKRLKGSDNIPMELINEILLRLPAKSIRRFRCVSKLWGSILHHPNFTELFLTMSSARPRLLFLLEGADDEWNFYSSPQPQNPDGKSSLVVAADFYSKIRGKMYGEICDYASGLIHFPYNNVVCNPITGKCAILPDVMIYRKSISFLGFNPIDKQFKVLSEAYPFCFQRDHHTILTLGTGKLEWRGNIDCPWYNTRWSEGICINGVLYYLGLTKTLADILVERSDDEISDDEPSHVKIVCFDVRSEKFKLIDTKCYCDKDTTKLINYKGKLGGIILEHDEADDGTDDGTDDEADDGTDDGTDDEADDAIKLRMWVLEDVEKQEWSNYVYTLAPDDKIVDWDHVSVAGVTATGEIVLSMDNTSQSKPFYVFYFNPERNTLQSVEIQGFGENLSRVKVFIDHVEDLNFLKIEATSLVWLWCGFSSSGILL